MKKTILFGFLVCCFVISGSAQHSTGRAPGSATPGTVSPALGNGSISFGWVLDLMGNGCYTINNSDFASFTHNFNYSSSYGFFAGDRAGAQYYVADYYNKNLYVANFSTNSFNLVAPITDIPSGQFITGMTFYSPTSIMYFSTTNAITSYLYKLNLTTGALTTIGHITNAPGIIDIAINSDGELFGVDIVNDNLVSINRTTGEGIAIGPTGINSNYAQGLDFDDATGTLYWAAYNIGLGRAEFREINTSTGNSTLISAVGSEFDALALSGSATVPVNIYVIISLFGFLLSVAVIRFFRR